MTKRIGVLTGGGDCPGLNPAIKGLVNGAYYGGNETYEVIGLRDGWKSLVQPELPSMGPMKGHVFGANEYWRTLLPIDVEYWDIEGGTNLGSSRTNPYNPEKFKEAEVLKNIEALKLDALVAIGGEDTLGVAAKLDKAGVPVVGIPKTIDRDLPGTDYSLGFETALQIINDEVDRLRTTAGSHSRVFIIETMGRHAGHLALQGGAASGAYISLIPEHPFNISRVVRLLVERKMRGIRYSIVVVSEGAYPDTAKGPIVSGQIRDTGFTHVPLGGVGEWVRMQVERATDWDVRAVSLSHVQRGGAPCAYDRRIGRLFGQAAADLIRRGKSGYMTALKDGRITPVPISVVDGSIQVVDVKNEYDTLRYNAKRSNLL